MKKIIFFMLLIILFYPTCNALSSHYARLEIISSISNKQYCDFHKLSIGNLFENKYFQLRSRVDDKQLRNNVNNLDFFPQDIELSDDAFHGANSLHYMEWWYFDACFNDAYALQVNINVYNILGYGFVIININIYYLGNLKISEKKVYDFNTFNASKEKPIIYINNEKIMEGFIDNLTGNLIYRLQIEIEDISLDLSFIGTTRGWKGFTSTGGWGVILPRADVVGNVEINGTKHFINGIGYHDHNWEVTVLVGANFGWFWGKVNSDNYTITWADILPTWYSHSPLLVINTRNNGYLNINSENISIIVNDIQFRNGMFIPLSFTIRARQGNVSLFLNLEVLNTHYTTVIGLINYWRYYVLYEGSISIGNNNELIEERNVAEFIRFRFY